MMIPIEEELPHPQNGCQSLKLLAGSKGFTEENVSCFSRRTSKHARKLLLKRLRFSTLINFIKFTMMIR